MKSPSNRALGAPSELGELCQDNCITTGNVQPVGFLVIKTKIDLFLTTRIRLCCRTFFATSIMSSEAVTWTENVLGGIIFILYIVAALVLLSLLVIRLWKASVRILPSAHPRKVRRVWLFSFLSLLSFTTLSYHMLNVLISSYISWARTSGHALPREISWRGLFALHLWEWTKKSTLFQDFAVSICTMSNGNWWWTAHVLVFTMGWNVFMAVEGMCFIIIIPFSL